VGDADRARHRGGGRDLPWGGALAVVKGEGESDAGIVHGALEVDGGVEAAAEQDDGGHGDS